MHTIPTHRYDTIFHMINLFRTNQPSRRWLFSQPPHLYHGHQPLERRPGSSAVFLSASSPKRSNGPPVRWFSFSFSNADRARPVIFAPPAPLLAVPPCTSVFAAAAAAPLPEDSPSYSPSPSSSYGPGSALGAPRMPGTRKQPVLPPSRDAASRALASSTSATGAAVAAGRGWAGRAAAGRAAAGRGGAAGGAAGRGRGGE